MLNALIPLAGTPFGLGITLPFSPSSTPAFAKALTTAGVMVPLCPRTDSASSAFSSKEEVEGQTYGLARELAPKSHGVVVLGWHDYEFLSLCVAVLASQGDGFVLLLVPYSDCVGDANLVFSGLNPLHLPSFGS